MQELDYMNTWTWWKLGDAENRQTVDLPHDAMLTERRRAYLKEGAASGYFPGGSYIYEKRFRADPAWIDQTVMLEFEGVYQKAEVFLNGQRVGGWIYGYTNFYVELTGRLDFSGENVLRVEVNNSQTPNSRWYSGSGIYRPVHLLVGEKQHIHPNGLKISTKSCSPAVIAVSVGTTPLRESAAIRVHITKDGKAVAMGNGPVCELTIPDAELWSAQSPELYEIEAQIIENGHVVDTARERFGIRKLEWNAKTGLLCNGEVLKLRGGCIHHDNGPLGACEFEDAAYRRIRRLKDCGYNAVRSSHNPISKALLRACDELGMYVMDETFDMWVNAKNDYDYSLYFEQEYEKDLTAMIEKDFNHPSVILYSIGNEIGDVTLSYGQDYHRRMTELCHRLDPTRPVTNSVNVMSAMAKPKDKLKPVSKYTKDDLVDPDREVPASRATGSKLINNIVTLMPMLLSSVKPKAVKNNLREIMDHEDIVGLNYGDHLMEGLHMIDPERLMLNTETFPKSIGKNWPVILRNPHVIGDFMWTGWDYLGEAGIGVALYGKQPKQFNKPYPCISAGIGSIDLIGNRDSQGYYAAVVWGAYTKPYIGVRPLNHAGEKFQMGQWRGTDTVHSWTWPGYEGTTAEVHVFSRGERVELLLNGKRIGTAPLLDAIAKFTVTYVPGTLTAVSYDRAGKELAREELTTAGKEDVLTVVPEKTRVRANGQDLIFINVSITDSNGITKNLKEKKVHIHVAGAGRLQAVGSGNPITEESYLDSAFTTWQGRMLAVIRAGHLPGEIRITASAEGMREQCVTVYAE